MIQKRLYKRGNSITNVATGIGLQGKRELEQQEDSRNQKVLEAYLNVIDTIHVRKNLLDAAYETEILTDVYKSQAKLFEIDLNKILPGIRY